MTAAARKISEGRAAAGNLASSQEERAAGVTPAAAVLTVPVPPSVNELFRNVPGKGRVKTQVYKDWRAHALTAIRLQKVRPVPGYIFVIINVEMVGDRADLDNRAKAIFDAVVEAKIITDDNIISGFAMGKLPAANGIAHLHIIPIVEPITIDFRPSHDGARGGLFLHAPQPGDDNGTVHFRP